jgi:hypothetical protein
VASGPAVLASSGALQNLTSLLPPSVQSYLDITIDQIATALSNSSQYIAAILGVRPYTVLYSILACIGLAIPFTMSRYGWSGSRGQISPYSSTLDGGVPNVTDEDFSYITSQDLEDSTPPGTSAQGGYHPRHHSATQPIPEDDILLIRNKGVTYPIHFPAYSIGDGKLRVRDVRDRVGLVMELSESRTRRIKMQYKGKQLKEPLVLIRDYGVKNKSELLVVLGEETDGDSADSEDSSEEMVVVAEDSGRGSSVGVDDGKTKRKKKRKSRRKTRQVDGYESATSPRDSGSNVGSTIGSNVGSNVGSTASNVRTSGQDDDRSGTGRRASAAIDKLNVISTEFTTKLLPLCVKFTAGPPVDSKKREDEHRKLSETVMQQVILKLDAVETNGDEEARAKRKALVKQVQEVLKGMDGRLRG